MNCVKYEVQTMKSSRPRPSGRQRQSKKSTQQQNLSTQQFLNAGYNPRCKTVKRFNRTIPEVCSCRATGWSTYWNLTANSRLAFSHRKIHTKDCSLYKSTNCYVTTINYSMYHTLFDNLVRLRISATFGARGLSLGISTQTDRRVEQHHLDSFFRDLYKTRYNRDNKYDHKHIDGMVKLAHRQLWTSFNSGLASPYDVDCNGDNLLHVILRRLDLTVVLISSRSKFNSQGI